MKVIMRRMMPIHLLASLVLLLALASGCSRPAEVETIRIAAASDLKFALDELTNAFHRVHPHIRVVVSHGSSGNFFAQLQQEAPYDLFLSADTVYAQRLLEKGQGLETNVFVYALGRIVLWVPANSALDLEGLGMQAVLEDSVKKVAIANPQHAPYGRAAVAALQHFELYDRVAPRLIYGENVAQAAQFVQSSAADIGIIALPLAAAPPMRSAGRYWEIPAESYPRMEQGGLILKWARHPGAARLFRDFLLSPEGRGVLERNGFFLPELN